MKIGILVPTIYMSPRKFGSMLFAPRKLSVDLADGLVARGHEVYLFAAPGLTTKATLVPGEETLFTQEYTDGKLAEIGGERAKWGTYYWMKRDYELDLTEKCFSMAREGKLDIIHSYHDQMAHFFDETSSFPTVYTLHDPLPDAEHDLTYWLYNRYRDHRFVSVSNNQRHHTALALNFVGTVYHGLRLDDYPLAANASDYVLIMGRLVPEKGMHDAIQAAIQSGTLLEIGTNFPDRAHETEYFKTQVKPYLDSPFISEPGIVRGDDKSLLYKEARALLFPIHWEEPFGMVMIEAMVCGTPVIAYNRGSVPEIVRDGVTGFIIDENDDNRPGKGSFAIKKQGVEGLVEAIRRIGEIDRAVCRKHVEENFSVGKMAEGYERVYEKVRG